MLLLPASSDLCYLNSDLATSPPANQPARQPGSFPFVHHCLNPPHLGWSILGTAGAQNSDSQKRKKSLCNLFHHLQVHTFIYWYALHPLSRLKVDKESTRLFPHITRVFNDPKVISFVLYVPMSVVSLATSWTQMEMDLSKLTHNVPFCYFRRVTFWQRLNFKSRRMNIWLTS